MIVDCVIHKAPDGFAGLCRLDAATRTWLKELTLIFERLAKDYIMLVFNCHLLVREVALSVSMCFYIVSSKDNLEYFWQTGAKTGKSMKMHIYIYFSNSMEIIQKEYFLRIFQSVFFVLPIMQYNVLLKIPSLALLVMQTWVRYVNCLDLMIFNRAMEKTISSCKLGK